jgi:hypothetical protein
LTTPGPVLLKKNLRSSKYDPLVEEVELLDCNPHYALIRLPGGREETVSVRQLAPAGNDSPSVIQDNELQDLPVNSTPETECNTPSITESSECNAEKQTAIPVVADNIESLYNQQQRTRPYFLRNREV